MSAIEQGRKPDCKLLPDLMLAFQQILPSLICPQGAYKHSTCSWTEYSCETRMYVVHH